MTHLYHSDIINHMNSSYIAIPLLTVMSYTTKKKNAVSVSASTVHFRCSTTLFSLRTSSGRQSLGVRSLSLESYGKTWGFNGEQPWKTCWFCGFTPGKYWSSPSSSLMRKWFTTNSESFLKNRSTTKKSSRPIRTAITATILGRIAPPLRPGDFTQSKLGKRQGCRDFYIFLFEL